jgi:hypothetical protein
VERLRRQRNQGSAPLDDVHDFEQQFLLGFEKGFPVAG